METGTAHKKSFYRPELDGLRFFAFFTVFLHHALQNQSLVIGRRTLLARGTEHVLALFEQAGNFGMSLFFVLSAYLITRLLLMELDRTGTVQVKAFYLRRILRIWPLYFFFLALCVGIGMVYPAFHVSGGRLAAFLLLAANLYLIAHTFQPVEMAILWSISIEEQFYLLWPGVVLLGRGRRGIAIANLFFVLASVVTLVYLGIAGVGGVTVWLNSVVEFLFFATGAQLALMTERHTPLWSPMARVGVFCAGIFVWLVAAESTKLMQQPGPPLHAPALLAGYGMAVVGTVLIFLSVLGVSAESVPAWLRYLGKISFGLYVYHQLMQTVSIRLLAGFAHWLKLSGYALLTVKASVPVLSFGLTLASAALSYTLLESPFLQLRKRFTVVANRPV